MACQAAERFGYGRTAFAIALLCAWSMGCGDSSHEPEAGPSSVANAGSANSGTGGDTTRAAGGTGGDNPEGGEAGSMGASCTSDADCDSSHFCAGAEICVIDPGTNNGYCQP